MINDTITTFAYINDIRKYMNRVLPGIVPIRRKKVHLDFPFEANAHEPQGESRQSPTERGRLDFASARELREPGIKMVTKNIFLFSKKYTKGNVT